VSRSYSTNGKLSRTNVMLLFISLPDEKIKDNFRNVGTISETFLFFPHQVIIEIGIDSETSVFFPHQVMVETRTVSETSKSYSVLTPLLYKKA
jgi:hypothetical protein